jgi:hypothetical protein
MLVALVVVACEDRGAAERPEGSTAQGGPSAPSQPPGLTSRGVASTGGPQTDAEEPSSEVDDSGDEDEDEPLDCAPPEPRLKPLQLLRFTFTTGVKNKDPRQKLNIARPGQRVWAHLRVRNRSGRDRCLHLVFRVNGKKRTELDLKIGESWNWRTYGYNTLKSSDRSGVLEFEATDDQGNLVAKKRLPIVPEGP